MRQLTLKEEGELTSRTPRTKHAADCRRWAGINLFILSVMASRWYDVRSNTHREEQRNSLLLEGGIHLHPVYAALNNHVRVARLMESAV
jgi:hypothetical protein